jgi:ferredoxin
MKIAIDQSLCESHGQCEYVAPDLFRLDDDGTVAVTQDPTGSLRPQAELAASVCPALAITVTD